MAQQVGARLKGDDYQHLFSWYHCLGLMIPETGYYTVTLENDEAGSVDDVTVDFVQGFSQQSKYFQVKFHVDQRGSYSSQSLTETSGKAKTSLLKKFYDTWVKLCGENPQCGELILVSNWSFDSTDNLKDFVSGDNSALKEDFFTGGPQSHAGKIRKLWREHLEIDDNRLSLFCRTLRLKIGHASTELLVEQVSERMGRLSLETSETILMLATSIVRNLIKANDKVLVFDKIATIVEEAKMRKLDRGKTTIHMNSIVKMNYETSPDYLLDWTELFDGDAEPKSHRLINPGDWHSKIMVDITKVKEKVVRYTPQNLISIKGQARLSCWFAIGFTFPSVGGFTVEVKQRDVFWNSGVDYSSSSIEALITTDDNTGLLVNENGDTLAVGLSVTGDLANDVLKYISKEEREVKSVLFIEPHSGTGDRIIKSNEDALKFVADVKVKLRTFTKHHDLQKLQIYYYGPLSVACFLGHNLNALCKEIQIMENDGNSYFRSIVLQSS